MTATLTIVRHGNTFAPGETPLRIGALTDIPLAASGVAQGEALARHFADRRFDLVLASPLRRTRETAALILQRQINPPLIASANWLAEIDHGPDEGQTDEAIVARIGLPALTRWDASGVAPEGWIVDMESRIAAWRALYTGHTLGDLLLITSNGAARFALMGHAALLGAARALPTMKLRTGAWGTITIADDGTPALREWDRRPA